MAHLFEVAYGAGKIQIIALPKELVQAYPPYLITLRQPKRWVVVVGASPVGLLTALRPRQASIDTLLLESHTSLFPATRASVYMPVVIPVLRSLDIFEPVRSHAFLNHDGAAWRDRDGRQLA